MRIKVGVAGLHRIEDIREVALDLLEGQHAPQVAGAAEPARQKYVEKLLFFFDLFKKLVALELFLIGAEIDFNHEKVAGRFGSARGRALPPWVIPQANLQTDGT